MAATAEAAELTPARQRVTADRVLVIAHRGVSAHYPENTLAAFRAALAAKPDLVELDYHHSADGVPVVFHDPTLDRTTDAVARWGQRELPVERLTVAQLRQLDAGSWFDARFAGQRIPTLSEALEVIQASSTTLIERKTGDAATCVRLLKARRLVPHVVVQAFDWQFLRRCHELEPSLTLAALGDRELTPEKLTELAALGVPVVGWSQQHLGPREIEALHRLNVRVWAYTVNERERAETLILQGIDGLITDDPVRLGQWLPRGSRR